MAVEVAAGILAGSLALLSDAAHMLTDAGALALALVAARLAARPPTGHFTFGLGRAEILSAQVNGAALLVLAGVIAIEAVQRLSSPPDVEGGIVVAVGLLGAVVNVAAAWQLARAERRSLNVEGARAHVLADLYASLGAAAAGAMILATGFREADAIAALAVAALMLRSGWGLLRDAGRVLLEGSPAGCAPRTSAARWPGARASSRSTTCTCGRSPRASRRSPRTCSCARATTATPAGASSSCCWTSASASATRRCRSTTSPERAAGHRGPPASTDAPGAGARRAGGRCGAAARARPPRRPRRR